jgi:(1->4)-alpha-D-glucan 1-alpha-D-glucosylmutase
MALGIFMACFPVYRVYIEKLPAEINDEQLIVHAFVDAAKRHPEYNYHFGILRQLFEPDADPVRNQNRLLFAQRLMQFTGPLAAKGIEDTTFYQYNALISHNEVGDQPCVLGIPVRQFHEKMQERLIKNSLSFNCTSTHDTKRGEDNRIRINILSELAPEWATLVAGWQVMNEPYRKSTGELPAPVINDEYFLYQAITGGFPEDLRVTGSFVERTKKYFIKVLRESKLMSDHVNPDLAYEKACTDFIDHLLNPSHSYLPSLLPFVEKIIRYANTYTMVQVVIKCTAPGIPDIYQGCELWDLSYVDPDNRRPVDYRLRRELLHGLKVKEKDSMEEMHQWAKENYAVGAQKLLVTTKLLQLRKKYKQLFLQGEYIPVYSEGSDRIAIAYLRHFEETWILMVLPVGIVADRKKDLQLILPEQAPADWKDIFTGITHQGTQLDIKSLLAKFPVSVLINQ